MPDERLYETDFYTWTQQQAERLRSLRGHNQLDTKHLADEVADLGKRELRELRAHLRQLLIHLCKLAGSPADAPRAHWVVEAREHQEQARDAYSPGLRQHVDLDALWSAAHANANTLLAEHGETGLPRDLTCPFALDDLLAADFSVETAERRLQATIAEHDD